MNVAELIEKLQAVDPTLIVGSEGCDCDGPAHGVEVHKGSVTIKRLGFADDGYKTVRDDWDKANGWYEIPRTEKPLNKPPLGGDPPWRGGHPAVTQPKPGNMPDDFPRPVIGGRPVVG